MHFLDGPGPAAYSSETKLKQSDSIERSQPCKGWNLISAPALPIDKPAPLPGPGQYGIHNKWVFLQQIFF